MTKAQSARWQNPMQSAVPDAAARSEPSCKGERTELGEPRADPSRPVHLSVPSVDTILGVDRAWASP